MTSVVNPYVCAAQKYIDAASLPDPLVEYMAPGTTTKVEDYPIDHSSMGCIPLHTFKTFTWNHAALSLSDTYFTFDYG